MSVIDQMNIVATSAAVGLCLLCLSPWLSEKCSAQTFRLTRSSDCTVLCSTSTPDETKSLSSLVTEGDELLPQVRCIRECICAYTNCVSLNYRSDTSECQFYFSAPTVCQAVDKCQYYQVTTAIISGIKLK